LRQPSYSGPLPQVMREILALLSLLTERNVGDRDQVPYSADFLFFVFPPVPPASSSLCHGNFYLNEEGGFLTTSVRVGISTMSIDQFLPSFVNYLDPDERCTRFS